MLVGLLAPGSARAHDPGGFAEQALPLTQAVTLDGVLQPGEWDDAATFDFTANPDDGRVWTKYDETYVYFAFRRVDPLATAQLYFQVTFDDGHDGTPTTGDDIWTLLQQPVGSATFPADGFYSGGSFSSDLADSGTNETEGGIFYTGGTGEVVFEMRHPRCSPDIAHDVCIPDNGDVVGVTFSYSSEVSSISYPAAVFDQANFGHFSLQIPPPPLDISVLGSSLLPASPREIAVNSATDRAYVAVGNGFDSGSFYVSVREGLAQIADIAAGSGDFSTGPTHVAVNEATNRAYVTHTGSNFARAIDGGTNTSIGTFATGAYPEGIVANPATNRLYIANTNSGSVWVFDTAADANFAMAAIPIPGSGAGITNLYLAFAPADRLYVTAPGLNKIFIVDTDTNGVVDEFAVPGTPSSIVASATTNRLYVKRDGTSDIATIDATTGAVLATIALPGPPIDLALNPTLARLYVTTSGAESDALVVIDTTTNAVLGLRQDVGATTLHTVAVNPANGRIYVTTQAPVYSVIVLDDTSSPPPPPAVPETTIDSAPSDYEQGADATFEFSSDQPDATFECSLDGGTFVECATGATFFTLAEGPHRFEVRALSGSEVDETPAVHRWSVDTVPAVAGAALDQHQGVVTTTDGGMSLGGAVDHELGQVFTPGVSGTLSEVRVAIKCGAGVPMTATVEIQDVDGTPTGTILATATATGIDNLPVYRRFVFSAPIDVNVANEYAIVLSGDTSVTGCFVLGTTNTNPYPGTMFFRDTLNPAWQASNEDLPFATFVEPSAGGGLILGGLDGDFVFLLGYTPDSSVHVTVGEGYAADITVSGAGFAEIPRAVHGQDLVPGLEITAGSKTLTLEDVTFDELNPVTESARGTAPPGRDLDIYLWSQPGPGGVLVAHEPVTADAEGQWSVTFEADVNFGMVAAADLRDEDGDVSRADRFLHAPIIHGSLAFQSISLSNWQPGTVDVSVDGVSRSVSIGATGFGNAPAALFGKTLAPEIVITADQGDVHKSLTLASLTAAIDTEADTVTGTAPPSATVNVNVFNPGSASRQVTASPTGEWTADFSGTFDIVAGTTASAFTSDEDGDTTDVSVTAAPETTIDSGPEGTSNSDGDVFTFSSPTPSAFFECRVDDGPWQPCTSPKTVYVASGPRTFRVRAVVASTADPTPADHSWTANVPPPAAGSYRVDMAPSTVDNLDPARANFSGSSQILRATCATLLGNPDQNGSMELVPEAAADLPTVTGDGRVYTFALRAGWTFADGTTPLTAESFRAAIERALDPATGNPALLTVLGIIEGASEFASGSAPNVSGVLVVDDHTLQITLTQPDYDFMHLVAHPSLCPVPPGTPHMPLPSVVGSGPYTVASVSGAEILLQENGFYGGSRPHGFDAIEINLGVDREQATARAIAGDSDYAVSQGALQPDTDALWAAYGPDADPQRFFVNPSFNTAYLFFNTEHGLLGDARLRQAINFALDRAAIGNALAGSTLGGTETDQYLPVGFPGFENVDIYPTGGPNLDQALGLAADAGVTPGNRVAFNLMTTAGNPNRATAVEIIRDNLAAIGIDVDLQFIPAGQLFGTTVPNGEHDIALFNFVGGGTTARFLRDVFRSGGASNFTRFTNASIDGRMDDALATLSPAGDTVWAGIEQDLVSIHAPAAGLMAVNSRDLFSARMRGQAFHPATGMSLAALTLGPQTYVVTNTGDTGPGSLRQAILDANANTPAHDAIEFAIPGDLPSHPILLASALPPITDAVTIDGASQPAGKVVLVGTGVAGPGLQLDAGGSTVRGLVIRLFPGPGILVQGQGATIEGNYIGTDYTGLEEAPNAVGIRLEASNDNVIRDNLISGNTGNGIEVAGDGGDGNYVFDNQIGVSSSGGQLGNGGDGISVSNSDFTIVGDNGTLPEGVPGGGPNTIAYNGGDGVDVASGGGNRVVANSIHNNAGLGIRVAAGANGDQGAPTIQSIQLAAGSANEVNVVTTFNAPRAGTYRVDYYAQASCDGAEGERHLGHDLTFSEAGPSSIDSTNFGPVAPGEAITATVTGPGVDGNPAVPVNTSELSACVGVRLLVVTNTNDSGAGSLRQAIQEANTADGPDVVHFDIPGEGPHTIRPLTALPIITEAVTIDGYTQNGAQPHDPESGVSGLSDVVLMVEIDDSLVSDDTAHAPLWITGPDSVIRGLVLNGGTYGLRITEATATGNRVEGNFVGTNATGTAAKTNDIYGVIVSQNASGNVVEGNLISGNTGSQGTNGNGVGLALGAHDNTVTNNWIGTRRNGVDTLPNNTGVAILSGAHDNVVGGESFPSNFIAGNNGSGVHVQQAGTDRNVVQGNFIGVTWILGEDDRRDVGNGGDGVTLVGGSQTSVVGNTIANNGGAGVRSTFEAERTTIQSRIRNSGQLGIDVGPNGVTQNDTPDDDGVQNFPVLTSASQTESGGNVEVAGTLDTAPGEYTITIFQSESCDPSGHGEGQSIRGSITVTTDEFGEAAIAHSFAPLAGESPTGQVVTATATDSNGNTSEFSACATISAPEGAAQLLSLSVDEPTGGVGAASVPLSSVPGELYPLFAGVPQAAPIPSSAVGSAPIPSSPIPSSPIPSSPIPSSPIPSSPIPSSGLGGVPDFVLDRILLSSIPGVDWPSILGANVPLQTLTLLDAKDELLASSATVGELGLERTVFRNARFLSFLFGGVTLDKIPPYTQAGWCGVLTSCVGVDVTQTTVLGIDLAGYVEDWDAIGGVTIGQITDGLSGPASAPIPSSPIPSSPIPSSAILQSSIQYVLIGTLPIPSSVVDCSLLSGDCNAHTLGDAARAGAILDGATWADVLPALGDREMVEFVTAYIGLANLPWETFPIDGFQLFSGIGQSFHYHLDASIVCPASSAEVNVLLGHGFIVKPDSSELRVGSGAFQPVDDPETSPTDGATWQLTGLSCPAGAQFLPIRVNFEALAGLRLGTFRGTATVTGGGFVKTATAQAPTMIVQNHEIDDDPAAAPIVQKDVLVVGSIPAGDRLDARRFDLSDLAPGTIVQAYLRPPTGTDLDLYLSKPGQQSLLSSPIPSSPIPSSPIPSSPLEDTGTSVNTQSANLPPEGLADAPIPSSEISSSSISRSDEVEVARVVVQNGDTGFLKVVVAGYNGAHSADPYTLRIKVIPPPQLPACEPRTFDFSGTNGTLPVGVDADTKALFLINRGSMERTYGAAAVATLRAKLAEVAGRDEVLGEVVEIDGDLDVRAAKTAWDADPCSVEKANDYVRKINALLAGYRATLLDLESIVLVGTDEQIAMARVPDLVADTNESTAAVDVAFTTAAGGPAPVSNALYASLATGHVLTDAAYGAATEIPFLGRELYLEEDAVGRLVETPAEIVGTLQQYLDSQGVLDLQSSFTTGYDFMQDGAQAVHTAFGDVVGTAQAASEINDNWGSGAVSGLLSGAETAPSLFSPNAHTNHWQLLPATASLADLVSSGLLPMPAAPQFPGAVILTIGCHAGLNVADTLPSGGVPERQRDWSQGFLQNRAAVYVANTGYGYGHYEAVALSERLFSLVAQNLSTATTLGEAWVDAKQEYFSTMGAYDVYDEKALVQATFYGLPFWRFEESGVLAFSASSSSAPTLGPDPLGSGLQVATGSTTPTLTRNDVPGRGSFWTPPNGDLEFHHRRSLQPRLTFPFDRSGTLTAHGVRLRALTTADHTGVDPLYGNATIANSEREPEPDIVDTFWPAAPLSLHRLPSGDSKVVFVAGQSRPNDVQRLFTHAAFDVLYSSSSDLTPPEIVGAGATFGSSTTFWVQARGGPVRAFVLYTAGASQWTFLQLQPVVGTPGLFSATVQSLSGTDVEFAAGVEDAAGNVGYIFNKGELLTPAAPQDSPFAISITSPGHREELFLNEPRTAVYGCASAAGVRTCVGPVPTGDEVPTGTPGDRSFTVEGTDLAGANASRTHRYTVRYRFSDFRSPLTSGLNAVKAGQTVPVKWSLGDFDSAFVRSLDSVRSVTSHQIPCPGDAPSTITEVSSASSSALRYDSATEQFVYTWRTERPWAGQCRRLTFDLADGTSRTADFLLR